MKPGLRGGPVVNKGETICRKKRDRSRGAGDGRSWGRLRQMEVCMGRRATGWHAKQEGQLKGTTGARVGHEKRKVISCMRGGQLAVRVPSSGKEGLKESEGELIIQSS
ncbi:hypothetical protein GOP47_0010899 [Adiantum capillus-veneris]|uniref:Uncharacterized protein n=1 Tax=Adiantum capillus-veneris TaxID=13818 RepID=A0A9D4UVU2_ADICA|nr:hypothetical protein GOP47_0010899 [Adiantum capillus-veneris]